MVKAIMLSILIAGATSSAAFGMKDCWDELRDAAGKGDVENVRILIAEVPEEQRLDFFWKKDEFGNSVFRSIDHNAFVGRISIEQAQNVIKAIADALPETERVAFINIIKWIQTYKDLYASEQKSMTLEEALTALERLCALCPCNSCCTIL